MAARKMKTKKRGDNARRLTDEEKSAIATADAGTTNVELAQRFNTSIPTILKWRKRGGGAVRTHATTTDTGAVKGRPGRRAASQTPTMITVDGDFVIVQMKIPKHEFHRDLLSRLLS